MQRSGVGAVPCGIKVNSRRPLIPAVLPFGTFLQAADLTDNPYTPPTEANTALSRLESVSDRRPFSASILGAFALTIAVVTWNSVSTGVPKIYSPFPLLVILPVFLGLPPLAISVIAAIAFAASQVRQFQRQPNANPNVGFTVLLSLVTGSTAIAIAMYWRYGVHYQGTAYMIAVGLANFVFSLVCWLLWWVTRTPHRYRAQVLFGFTLFAWMFWYAIPYMGELP